jgi:hypothetical protein
MARDRPQPNRIAAGHSRSAQMTRGDLVAPVLACQCAVLLCCLENSVHGSAAGLAHSRAQIASNRQFLALLRYSVSIQQSGGG